MNDHNIPTESEFSLDLADETATAKLGSWLASHLRSDDVLALSGALGMGKTCLARSVIRNLAKDDTLEVPSPTFSLVQRYETGNQSLGEIWHVDFYRLVSEAELPELGLEDAFGQALVIIEWPEQFARHLPSNAFWIEFEASDNGTARKVNFKGGAWAERLEDSGPPQI